MDSIFIQIFTNLSKMGAVVLKELTPTLGKQRLSAIVDCIGIVMGSPNSSELNITGMRSGWTP